MKSFTTLLEQLTSEQQDYLYYNLHGRYYNPDKSHPEMFDSYPDKQNPHRIILPLETTNLNNKVNGQLKIHLKTHGWDIHNYHDGLASRSWREAIVDGTREDKDQILSDLREYCGLDTYAMVAIYEKLKELIA
jgi:hypothetical protein